MALNTPIKSLSRDDAEFEFMDNSINYVYSGRHTGEISANELNKECEKLYMLYNMALSSNNQSTNKINIIFKPHPRDSSEQNVLKTLKVALSNLYPNLFPNANDITWLYTINKNIPFELYISNGIFEDYSLKNRKVNIFGTYSTIFLMTYDYNLSANVSHFLLSQSDESAINYSFGTNSQLFPHSKRINI